jgi:hypothetical protein
MNDPGQTWRRAIRAVAAGTALLLSALTPAHPASIERRADGTLVVKAQGEHFVFSESDEQRIFFLGPKLRRCAENYDFRDPNPFKDLYDSLARWLHDPRLAPCFDSLVPTDSVADKTEFFFNIAPSRDNHVVYSGVFEPDFSGKHGALLIEGVGFVVNKAPQPGLPQPCVELPSDLPLEANFYRSKTTWVGLGDNKHIHSVEYSLPAERRLGGALAPVCVSCNIIAEWTCAEWIFSSDRSVRLWAQWNQRTREPHPDWLKIDAALRDVARAIFIDRPPGDFN